MSRPDSRALTRTDYVTAYQWHERFAPDLLDFYADAAAVMAADERTAIEIAHEMRTECQLATCPLLGPGTRAFPLVVWEIVYKLQ